MALSQADTNTTPAYSLVITKVLSAKISGFYAEKVCFVLTALEIFKDGEIFTIEIELPLALFQDKSYRLDEDVSAELRAIILAR